MTERTHGCTRFGPRRCQLLKNLYALDTPLMLRSVLFILLFFVAVCRYSHAENLDADPARFEPGQVLTDFRVVNLYQDADGQIAAVKLQHISSGAPLFILRMETAPQAFMWVDTPDNSNRGLAHSLEHLLASKGTKGRYFKLLTDMRLSRMWEASDEDFNYYGFASGVEIEGFFELLRASLDALYHPDFSDVEAETEFQSFCCCDRQ